MARTNSASTWSSASHSRIQSPVAAETPSLRATLMPARTTGVDDLMVE